MKIFKHIIISIIVSLAFFTICPNVSAKTFKAIAGNGDAGGGGGIFPPEDVSDPGICSAAESKLTELYNAQIAYNSSKKTLGKWVASNNSHYILDTLGVDVSNISGWKFAVDRSGKAIAETTTTPIIRIVIDSQGNFSYPVGTCYSSTEQTVDEVTALGNWQTSYDITSLSLLSANVTDLYAGKETIAVDSSYPPNLQVFSDLGEIIYEDDSITGYSVVSITALESNIPEGQSEIENSKIMIGTDNGYLHITTIDDTAPSPVASTELKISDAGDAITSGPTLCNLDADEDKEVLVGTEGFFEGSTKLVAIDFDSEGNPSVLWDSSTDPRIVFDFPIYSSPAVGDLDNLGDGSTYIVVGSEATTDKSSDSNTLHIIKWNNEAVEDVITPLGISGNVNTSPALADINGNGKYEIIFRSLGEGSATNGKLYMLNSSGESVINPIDGIDLGSSDSNELFFPFASSPVIGELSDYPGTKYNQDKDLEIVAATQNGNIFVFHHDGTQITEYHTDHSENIYKTPLIADIDDYPGKEIIISTDDNVYIFNINYSLTTFINKIGTDGSVADEDQATTPTVADIDGDGNLELLVTSGDHIEVLYDDSPATSNDVDWGQFRKDNDNSGVYDRGDREIPTVTVSGSTLVAAGQPLSLTVEADDNNSIEYLEVYFDDEADTVLQMPVDAFNTSGNPYPLPNAGDTVTNTFEWTPQDSCESLGKPSPCHTITFIATDEYGLHSTPVEVPITVTDPVQTGPAHVCTGYNYPDDCISDHPTIQEAIDAASSGNTILVDPDTYTENIHFNGKSLNLASTTKSLGSITIIGAGAGSVIDLSNSSGESALTGLIVENGNASGDGGGILISGTSNKTNIINCRLNNNTSSGSGGAIAALNGADVLLQNVQMVNNESAVQGSDGLYTENSDVLAINSSIVNHTIGPDKIKYDRMEEIDSK